ncbi:hypothetical protein [Thauera sp. 27]|uniref:hypothetical protein n=1 Tax=Thauera sp. 27 TaxID=305700 RepID=UPI00031D8D98|nr:hypothetical protein [Thauera sp. 27]
MVAASKEADRYILRFEQPGHRSRLKEMAAREKRSLNKQLLILIEKGEEAVKKEREARQ